MKKTVLILAFSLLIVSTLATRATNWSQVTSFSGSGFDTRTTDFFTCTHIEWRISWNYIPDPTYPNLAAFTVRVYPQGSEISAISVLKMGANETSGVSYVHNNNGTFYCYISVANTQTYNVTIEQDVDSPIPEIPLGVFFVVISLTLLLIIYSRRRTH